MFSSIKRCKICSKFGKTILEISFDDIRILNFFTSEYNKKITNLLKKKIGKKKFILEKCKDCQFIWQRNVPKNKFLYDIYEKIIDPKESLQKSQKILNKQIKFFSSEIIFFQNFLKKNDLNILDFGAGWGNWLLSIKNKCPNVFAVEFSNKRKKYLKEKNIKIINNLNKTNHKNFFHVVKLEQVLEHLTDMKLVILNIKRIMKKNGILSIGVPDGYMEIDRDIIEIKKGPIQPLEHLNCFNNKSLKLFLRHNGFRPITLFEIIKIFIKIKKFDYHSIKFFLSQIKNTFFSTRINFIKN